MMSLVCLAGCNRSQAGLSKVEPYLPDDASVVFKLEPARTRDGSQQWIGTYESKGKVARFRIELGSPKAANATATEFHIRSGEGRLIPEPESDSSLLLLDLQRALQAKKQYSPAPRKTTVSFLYASIGEELSQANGGGFSAKPPGNWTAMKLFLGEGEQEGEVFLNINANTRTGEFSMKDSEYGDFVLTELAKVL
jgi:hypothetical protein